MMLQDVDNQKGTIGRILDMPGAAHSLTFQSVPSKSKFHARIDIHPVKRGMPTPGMHLKLDKLKSVETKESSGFWPALDARSASSDLKPSTSEIPAAY